MRRVDAPAFPGRAADAELHYPDSVGSSPRSSVGADKFSFSEEPLPGRWDEHRVKLMCSFGGRIVPRPHDNQLRYVGGETHIVVVSRNVMYAELTAKLFKVFGTSLTIKYQLPSEDLDALISVTSDEDLENMLEEYDRLQLTGGRSSRLRLFVFPAQLESQTSLSSLLNSSCNRENWFVDALNGMPVLPRTRSSETSSSIVSETPDYLFGLDSGDDWPAASRSAPNSSEHFPEKLVVAPVLGSLLQGISGELPNSAPGSPLKRLPMSLSTSSAPPAMMSVLSAAVDALKAGATEPTKQTGGVVPQVTRDVGRQDDVPVSQESPTSQAPIVSQVTRDAVSQGPVIVCQDRGRDPTNQATIVPQIQVTRDANSQGPVLVQQGRGSAEKNETFEDRAPTNFTGSAGELNSGSNQWPEALPDDTVYKPPTNGSKGSSPSNVMESFIVQTQKLSPQQQSNPPADLQQQRSLPEVTGQAGISSQGKQDPVLESATRVVGGKALLNVGEENQTLSAAKGTVKATDEQHVLESFRNLKLDDMVSSDPRANQLEKEQSNFEIRQMDSTGRAGADASKVVGESRFVQLISTYNTSKQGVEEGLRFPQASSPPLPADPFTSSQVPPLPSQAMMMSTAPIKPGGDVDNSQRSPFYQQQQQSPPDELVQASSRYATQGPAIKLPIISAPTPAPVAPLFSRSDSQQQVLRQLQTTGASPLLVSNAGPPTPVTVYPSTSLQVEGVPMRGTTGIPVQNPFTQFQRQVINDPTPQFQRPTSIYREYHTPITHTAPPAAALPSRFRPMISAQPAQFDGKVTAGVRSATGVPSSRPPAPPAQLFNYYNMEQLNAFAAAGMSIMYDPVNAAYIVGPNNSGVPRAIASLAKPFVDEASGIAGTYQEVLDVPSNLQNAPGAAAAGENRLPSRQFIMRN